MKSHLLVALFCVFAESHVFAKIGDPPGVAGSDRFFCSHENQVFAIRTKDRSFNCAAYDSNRRSPPLIWKTILPFDIQPQNLKPDLEQDVQLCIIQDLSLEKSTLVVHDCHRNSYRLNAKTGALKK